MSAPSAFKIAHLFDRNLVGQNKDAFVAADRRDKRKADARIAARRLDDRAAFFENAFFLGPVDHRNADAVLDRITRVQALHLGKDLRLDLVLFCDVVDLTSGVLPISPRISL